MQTIQINWSKPIAASLAITEVLINPDRIAPKIAGVFLSPQAKPTMYVTEANV